MDEMHEATKATLSKVPEVTLSFWIIKIAATTLGETGGDSVTMTLNWGYLVGTAIFLAALVACQIAAKKFHPFLYWATIVRRQRLARPWRILPIAPWASATPAVPHCCFSL
jgi:uncharacterized membrane-anchored protein